MNHGSAQQASKALVKDEYIADTSIHSLCSSITDDSSGMARMAAKKLLLPNQQAQVHE